MVRFLIGLFIILHGLVHLWYFTLSQRLVEFKPEMGWIGKSWVLSDLLSESITRVLASSLFLLTAIAFVISGFGIFFRAAWWWQMIVGSALLSLVILLLFWDGGMQRIVQKGLIGFLISIVILFILVILKRPSIAFKSAI